MLANCPFDALAREHTELVCGLNEGFVRGVLDGVGCAGTEARLDPSRSRVYDRDRGITNRVEDVFSDHPGDEQPLYELATRKLSEAAKADPELRKRAQENTQHMLEGMMRGLGFERVTVRFQPAS